MSPIRIAEYSSAEEMQRQGVTAEVAAVCAIGFDDARGQLGHVATEQHIGCDGLWSLQPI
jgi:hypothetical protein